MALMGSEGRAGADALPCMQAVVVVVVDVISLLEREKREGKHSAEFLTYFHGPLETGARRRLSVEWSIQRLIERNRGNCFPSVSREYGTDGQVSGGRQNFLLTMKNMLNVSALICNNLLQKKKYGQGRTFFAIFNTYSIY